MIRASNWASITSREAAEHLNACLADGSRDLFLLALRQVAEARDCASRNRREAGPRNALLISLKRGQPNFDATGLKLSVEPKKRSRKAA